MRQMIVFIALVLTVIFAPSCGKDDCFSIGPVGDCATKYPTSSTDRGGSTSGALRAYVADATKVIGPGGKMEIKAEGGVRPYKFRIDKGTGHMGDATGATPSDNTGNWFFADATARGTTTIRVNDNANGEIRVSIEVQ